MRSTPPVIYYGPMYDFDDAPEPYENDLEELGNREAWEDSQADMRDDAPADDEEPADDEWEGYEDRYLDGSWEDRCEMHSW